MNSKGENDMAITTRTASAMSPEKFSNPMEISPKVMNLQRTEVERKNAEDESTSPSPPGLETEVQRLIGAATEVLSRQHLPVATYRVQMNRDFTLRQAVEVIPYLAELGITDLYSSPLLKAARGSNHGYDVVAHDELNPEIGTPADLESLSLRLKEMGMGMILDVVPNHMSVATGENHWWNDVLENGPSSPYAGYFDIDWMPLKPDLANKVLLPVLGDQFGKVLEEGDLRLVYESGCFFLDAVQGRFPIAPRTYALILSHRLEELQARLGADSPELQEYLSIVTAISHLPKNTETSAERVLERHREKEVVKRRLRELTASSEMIAEWIESTLSEINGSPAIPDSFDKLDEILSQQAYRLAYWRVAADEINYRRFFDVNNLAAICMEKPEVFEATHHLVFEWIQAGIITGLRIDHPDGLFDPAGYLHQIQAKRFEQICRNCGRGILTETSCPDLLISAMSHWERESKNLKSPLSRPAYVVVEKILESGEPLPVDWQVHGTVGYEFMNALNGLFVDPAGEKSLSSTYTRLTGRTNDFPEISYLCKRLNVRYSMSSELNVLAHRLDRISEQNRWTRDFTLNSLARSLQELIACFGIYRTYVQHGKVSIRDRRFIEDAVAQAKAHHPEMSEPVFDFIQEILLAENRPNSRTAEQEAIELFIGKFQQLTGPIMAKAIEDTAFYRYARLVSLNEVGGSPAQFGNSPGEFHLLNRRRLPAFSHSLSSTSTHDTKRSEDVRARINVLSEIPREWSTTVSRWMRRNEACKSPLCGETFPSRNDEYFLYQTLVGIWPEEGISSSLVERLQDYLTKAAREAKQHTSWINRNEEYESALRRFIAQILLNRQRRNFQKDLENFALKVRVHGRWNSLSQLILKIASPGVPDFYQGTELETLTLVDPDNRHPVDFGHRLSLLKRLPDLEFPLEATDAEELLRPDAFDRLKMFVTRTALHARRNYAELFTSGDYLPLEVKGTHADSIVALLRRQGEVRGLIVIPRLTVRVTGFGGPPPIGDLWKETTVILPEELYGLRFRDHLMGKSWYVDSAHLPVENLLRHLPVSLSIACRDDRQECST